MLKIDFQGVNPKMLLISHRCLCEVYKLYTYLLYLAYVFGNYITRHINDYVNLFIIIYNVYINAFPRLFNSTRVVADGGTRFVLQICLTLF